MNEITKPSVLIVDDEPNILKTMTICLKDLDFRITGCESPIEALKIIKEESFDLAFVDLKMTPVDGIAILKEIKARQPETTVIIITAHGSIDSAVNAIKKGAFHYLQKPFDYIELQLLAKNVFEYHRLKQEVRRLKEQTGDTEGGVKIITRNKTMLDMIELAKRAADSDLSILIEGESGTGKELYAQLIVENSPRSKRPFIKINCAALPENLLESELFGHAKGSFTGAVKDRKGKFELADGGTLFLDEIAEMSPTLQAKILRVLQQQEFERVGENIVRKVNVRIIAATNKNLKNAIEADRFRKDLYYRLNAVKIKLAPLRERPEDIPVLVEYFIQQLEPEKKLHITSDTRRALQLHRWNGNVRELENIIQRAVLLTKNDKIEPSDLPEEIRSGLNDSDPILSLEEMEKFHIKKVLGLSKDLNEAAKMLAIDPATLWRKRKKYNL